MGRSGIWRVGSPRSALDEALADADSSILQRIDEASAVPAPGTVRETWLEKGYDAATLEQEHLYVAEAERATRRAAVEANGRQSAAEEAEFALGLNRTSLQAAQQHKDATALALGPYRRRAPHAGAWYGGRWTGLVIGDIAGITGAAVLYGEIPALALMQAVATGVAAVTAGVVGEDIKHLRLARQRQRPADQLSDAERPFADFFSGGEAGRPTSRAMVKVAAGIIVLVAAGIFTLRTGVEGTLSGVVFGALAAAIACASLLSSYVYADDIADAIEAADANYRRELRRHAKLAEAFPLEARARAEELARSLHAEHDALGRAAMAKVRVLKFRALRANPGVVGHGPGADPGMVIGRRSREEDRP